MYKIKNTNVKKEEGITLVALAITIVILIILATVTINMAFGDNGLVKYAEEARDKTANSTIAEAEGINSMVDQFANVLADGGTTTDPGDPGETEKSEVEQAKEDGTKYTDTTPIKDDLDNTVYIPGGFHIAEDSATKVEGGIVIEDDSGNQFVWIPTGTYNVSTSINSAGTLTNELSRRQWGTTKDVVQEPTPITEDAVATGNGSAYYYGEGDSRSVAYTTIGEFLKNAKPVSEGGKGGFYIGRYEQGTGNVCKAGIEPYIGISRDQAKSSAEAMYKNRSEVKATSQLISSYAWDTALNFICQIHSEKYLLATTTDKAYGNINGYSRPKKTGEDENDIYNNIHDFLGNYREWTTEFCDEEREWDKWVARAQFYGAYRDYGTTDAQFKNTSFRVQLYV